jgi:hypothetical protein
VREDLIRARDRLFAAGGFATADSQLAG